MREPRKRPPGIFARAASLDVRGTLGLPDAEGTDGRQDWIWQGVSPQFENCSALGLRSKQLRHYEVWYNAGTLPQRQQRAYMQAAVAAWHALSPAEKIAWHAPAKKAKLNRFQTFCRAEIRRLQRLDMGPPPVPAYGPPPGPARIAAYAAARTAWKQLTPAQRLSWWPAGHGRRRRARRAFIRAFVATRPVSHDGLYDHDGSLRHNYTLTPGARYDATHQHDRAIIHGGARTPGALHAGAYTHNHAITHAGAAAYGPYHAATYAHNGALTHSATPQP